MKTLRIAFSFGTLAFFLCALSQAQAENVFADNLARDPIRVKPYSAREVPLVQRNLAGFPVTMDLLLQAYIDEKVKEDKPIPPTWLNIQEARRIYFHKLKGEFSRLSYADLEMFLNHVEDELLKLSHEERVTKVEHWVTRPPLSALFPVEPDKASSDPLDPRYSYQ